LAQRYGWTLEYIRSLPLDDVARLMVVYKEESTQAEKRNRAMKNKVKGAKK